MPRIAFEAPDLAAARDARRQGARVLVLPREDFVSAAAKIEEEQWPVLALTGLTTARDVRAGLNDDFWEALDEDLSLAAELGVELLFVRPEEPPALGKKLVTYADKYDLRVAVPAAAVSGHARPRQVIYTDAGELDPRASILRASGEVLTVPDLALDTYALIVVTSPATEDTFAILRNQA